MQPDDVYPNDSTWTGGVPLEPHEQRIERQKERAKTLEAARVLDDVIAHFQERVDFRDKLSSINIDLEKDPAMHQKMCEVNDLLKMALIEEKDLLEDLLNLYAPNR